MKRSFPITIRIIAAILVATFFAQDIVWANPDIIENRQSASTLQIPSFFQNITPEAVLETTLARIVLAHEYSPSTPTRLVLHEKGVQMEIVLPPDAEGDIPCATVLEGSRRHFTARILPDRSIQLLPGQYRKKKKMEGSKSEQPEFDLSRSAASEVTVTSEAPATPETPFQLEAITTSVSRDMTARHAAKLLKDITENDLRLTESVNALLVMLSSNMRNSNKVREARIALRGDIAKYGYVRSWAFGSLSETVSRILRKWQMSPKGKNAILGRLKKMKERIDKRDTSLAELDIDFYTHVPTGWPINADAARCVVLLLGSIAKEVAAAADKLSEHSKARPRFYGISSDIRAMQEWINMGGEHPEKDLKSSELALRAIAQHNINNNDVRRRIAKLAEKISVLRPLAEKLRKSRAEAASGVKFSMVNVPYKHILLSATPAEGDDLEAQAESLLLNIDKTLAVIGCGRDSIVRQTIFLKNLSDKKRFRAIMKDYYGRAPPPAVSYVIQPPASGQSISIEMIAIPPGSGISVTRISRNITIVGYDGIRWAHVAGLEPREGIVDTYEQALDVFGQMGDILTSNGFKFENILRTWIYQGKITGSDGDERQRYDKLNEARWKIFKTGNEGGEIRFGQDFLKRQLKDGIFPYPASTGISMSDGSFVMECVAISTKRNDIEIVPIENPRQTPVYHYGAGVLEGNKVNPLFSRGTEMLTSKGRMVIVSGTASIIGDDNAGSSIEEQTEGAIENIRLVLNEAGLELKDVAQLRVYIRDSVDYEKVKEIVEAKFGETAKLYTIAGVCRKQLLVELEALAYSDTPEKEELKIMAPETMPANPPRGGPSTKLFTISPLVICLVAFYPALALVIFAVMVYFKFKSSRTVPAPKDDATDHRGGISDKNTASIETSTGPYDVILSRESNYIDKEHGDSADNRELSKIKLLKGIYFEWTEAPSIELKRKNRKLIKYIADTYMRRIGIVDPETEYWHIGRDIVDQSLNYVLEELINNAFDAYARAKTGKGTVDGPIRLRILKSDDETIVEVSDNGIGFSGIVNEYDEFDVSSNKSKSAKDTLVYGGAGIGLPITKVLAQLHGGRMDILSPGVDDFKTTIRIIVPNKSLTANIPDDSPKIKIPPVRLRAIGPEYIDAEREELEKMSREAVDGYVASGGSLGNFTYNYDPLGNGPYWASSYEEAAMLLYDAGAKEGDAILDVGHGAGDTISFLAHIFKLRANGVEIVPEHNDFAVFLRDLMVSKGYLNPGQVTFENKDFMDESIDFSTYDFIYYFCKGTSDKKGLLSKLLKVKAGAKILMYGGYDPEIELELTGDNGFTCQVWAEDESLDDGKARIYTRVGKSDGHTGSIEVISEREVVYDGGKHSSVDNREAYEIGQIGAIPQRPAYPAGRDTLPAPTWGAHDTAANVSQADVPSPNVPKITVSKHKKLHLAAVMVSIFLIGLSAAMRGQLSEWLTFPVYYTLFGLIGYYLASRMNHDRRWGGFAVAGVLMILFSALYFPWYANIGMAYIPDLGLWSHSLRPLADIFIFSQPWHLLNLCSQGLRQLGEGTRADEGMLSHLRSKRTLIYLKEKIRLYYASDGLMKVIVLFWFPLCHFMYYSLSHAGYLQLAAAIGPVFAVISAAFYVQKPGHELTPNSTVNRMFKRAYLIPVVSVITMTALAYLTGNGVLILGNIPRAEGLSCILTIVIGYTVHLIWTGLVNSIFFRHSAGSGYGDTTLNSAVYPMPAVLDHKEPPEKPTSDSIRITTFKEMVAPGVEAESLIDELTDLMLKAFGDDGNDGYLGKRSEFNRSIRWNSQHNVMFIARDGDEVVGCVGLQKMQSGDVSVFDLAVKSSRMLEGIGTRLMDEAVEKCLRDNVESLAIMVEIDRSGNVKSPVGFYEKYFARRGLKFEETESSKKSEFNKLFKVRLSSEAIPQRDTLLAEIAPAAAAPMERQTPSGLPIRPGMGSKTLLSMLLGTMIAWTLPPISRAGETFTNYAGSNRMESKSVDPADSYNRTYYHFIDEDRYGRGYGRVDKEALGSPEYLGVKGYTYTYNDSTYYNVDVGNGSTRVINGSTHAFVGFGSGSHTSIQPAINEVYTSGGGFVIVREGAYDMAGGQIALKDGVRLFGGYDQSGIRDIKGSVSRIRNGYVETTGPITKNTEINGFEISYDAGYTATKPRHLIGIDTNGGLGKVLVINNMLKADITIGFGIEAAGSISRAIIFNNDIIGSDEASKRFFWAGIHFANGVDGISEFNRISTFYGAGITVNASITPARATIQNNFFSHNGLNNISRTHVLSFDAFDTYVWDNTFTGGVSAVAYRNADKVKIENNIMSGQTGSVIFNIGSAPIYTNGNIIGPNVDPASYPDKGYSGKRVYNDYSSMGYIKIAYANAVTSDPSNPQFSVIVRTYEYDSDGRLIRQTNADGSYSLFVDHWLDTGKVKTEKTYSSGGTLVMRSDFSPDDHPLVSRVDYRNGNIEAWPYGQIYRKLDWNGTNYHAYIYKEGHLIMENNPAVGVKAYNYDANWIFTGYTRYYELPSANGLGTRIKEEYNSSNKLIKKYTWDKPFHVGVNLPWLHYGKDIGKSHALVSQPVQRGFSTNRQALDENMRQLAGTVARPFVFCDLRSGLDIDGMGNIVDFDEEAASDLRELLDSAQANGVKLILTVFDYTLADGITGARYNNGHGNIVEPLGEFRSFITDSSKREQLKNAVLRLFDKVQLSRYSCVIGFDIMNEPEWTRDGLNYGGDSNYVYDPSWSKVPQADLEIFFTYFKDALHTQYPGKFVTVGHKDREELSKWSRSNYLYQFHYYDWMGNSPDHQRLEDVSAAQLVLNGPVFAGELQPTDTDNKLAALYAGGYQAGIFWRDNDKFRMSTETLNGIKDYFVGTIYEYDGHDNLINTIRVENGAAKKNASSKTPPPGSLYGVFMYLYGNGIIGPDKAITGGKIAKGLDRSYAHTLYRDVSALYYLGLIDTADKDASGRPGKRARWFVPENVKKKLIDPQKETDILDLLCEFIGPKLRPNRKILDEYIPKIRLILGNPDNAIISSSDFGVTASFAGTDLEVITRKEPYNNRVHSNLEDRAAAKKRLVSGISMKWTARASAEAKNQVSTKLMNKIKKARLKYRMSRGMMPSGTKIEDLIASIDINYILKELIKNAFDACARARASGKMSIRPIRLRILKNSGQTIIEVCDDGIGFARIVNDEDDLIVESNETGFFSQDRPELEGGVGIGLLLSKAAGQLHGARLEILPGVDGFKTTVRLIVPDSAIDMTINDSSADGSSSAQAAPAEVAPLSASEPEQFLRNIVDTKELTQNMVEGILSELFSNKKLTLAFSRKLSGLQSTQLKALVRQLNEWKESTARKNPKMKKLLDNFTVLEYDDLKSELDRRGIDSGAKDAVILTYAPKPEAGSSDTSSLGIAVRPVHIIEEGGSFPENYYYPLLEIVTVSLAKELLNWNEKDLKESLAASNITIDNFGIDASMDKSSGAMVFRVLPKMERYNNSDRIDRYTRLMQFLRAA